MTDPSDELELPSLEEFASWTPPGRAAQESQGNLATPEEGEGLPELPELPTLAASSPGRPSQASGGAPGALSPLDLLQDAGAQADDVEGDEELPELPELPTPAPTAPEAPSAQQDAEEESPELPGLPDLAGTPLASGAPGEEAPQGAWAPRKKPQGDIAAAAEAHQEEADDMDGVAQALMSDAPSTSKASRDNDLSQFLLEGEGLEDELDMELDLGSLGLNFGGGGSFGDDDDEDGPVPAATFTALERLPGGFLPLEVFPGVTQGFGIPSLEDALLLPTPAQMAEEKRREEEKKRAQLAALPEAQEVQGQAAKVTHDTFKKKALKASEGSKRNSLIAPLVFLVLALLALGLGYFGYQTVSGGSRGAQETKAAEELYANAGAEVLSHTSCGGWATEDDGTTKKMKCADGDYMAVVSRGKLSDDVVWTPMAKELSQDAYVVTDHSSWGVYAPKRQDLEKLASAKGEPICTLKAGEALICPVN